MEVSHILPTSSSFRFFLSSTDVCVAIWVCQHHEVKRNMRLWHTFSPYSQYIFEEPEGKVVYKKYFRKNHRKHIRKQYKRIPQATLNLMAMIEMHSTILLLLFFFLQCVRKMHRDFVVVWKRRRGGVCCCCCCGFWDLFVCVCWIIHKISKSLFIFSDRFFRLETIHGNIII